jgi:hypothetical protein
VIALDDLAVAGLQALVPELPAGARVIVVIEGPLHSCGGRALGAALSSSFSAREVGTIMLALAHRPGDAER